MNTLRNFTTGNGNEGQYYSLPALAEQGFSGISRMPVSLRIVLESLDNPGNMVIRLVDLIAPIGFGQRAMIVTPEGARQL